MKARGLKQPGDGPPAERGKCRKLRLPREDERDAAESAAMFALPARVSRAPSCSRFRPEPRGRASPGRAGPAKRSARAGAKGPPTSYLELRKQREGFRKRLVAFIVRRAGEGEEGDAGQLPNRRERELLRYHYYIRHGIDTAHVPPLDRAWLRNICALVPARLQAWQRLLRALTDQVQEEFVVAVKKSVVDFVLREAGEGVGLVGGEDAGAGPRPGGGDAVSPARRARYLHAAARTRRGLHVVSPLAAQLLDLWHKCFNEMRLVDVKELKKYGAALDLADFQQFVQKHIDNARDCLKSQWFPIIQNMFLQGNKKKLLPAPEQKVKLKRFYNCIAALMTYQLQSLCVASIQDFTQFICGVKLIQTVWNHNMTNNEEY